MRIAALKGEKTLSEFARRVFDIKGPKAKEQGKEAEAALLRANPHLRELRNVPEGTLVLVPEVAGVRRAGETEATDIGTGGVADELRRTVSAARRTLEESVASMSETAKKTLELHKTRELKKLADEDETLQDRLSKSAEDAKRSIEEAKALKTVHAQAFEQLDRDLDELLKGLT